MLKAIMGGLHAGRGGQCKQRKVKNASDKY